MNGSVTRRNNIIKTYDLFIPHFSPNFKEILKIFFFCGEISEYVYGILEVWMGFV